VYLDFLPTEGELAVFNQGWFFAKPTSSPYYREKVRIITESIHMERSPQWHYLDQDLVIEFEVKRAMALKSLEHEPFPYKLYITMEKGPGTTGKTYYYRYYSDEACTKPLQVDTLLTVNGKPPNGVYWGISEGGALKCIWISSQPRGTWRCLIRSGFLGTRHIVQITGKGSE
jgi:hypothetical protein